MKKLIKLILASAFILMISGCYLTYVPEVFDVSVYKDPDKIVYELGEELDLAGGVMEVIFDNGKTNLLQMTVTGVTTSGYDPDTLGEQTVTLVYRKIDTTFTVTVVPAVEEA